MSRDRLRLLHILDAIQRIRSYVKDRETFLAASLVQDAVIRNLEIIGEAVKALKDDLKAQRPEVPRSRGGRSQACEIVSSMATSPSISTSSGMSSRTNWRPSMKR